MVCSQLTARMEDVSDETLAVCAKQDGVTLPNGDIKVDTLVSECLGVVR